MKSYIKLLSTALLIAGASISASSATASTASTAEEVAKEMTAKGIGPSLVTLANAGKIRDAFPKFAVNIGNLKAVQSILRAQEEAVALSAAPSASVVDNMVNAGFVREMAEILFTLRSATISKTANVLLTETKPIGDVLVVDSALTEFAKLYSVDGTANKATMVNGHVLVKTLSDILAKKDEIVSYAVAVAQADAGVAGHPANAYLATFFPDADSVKKAFTQSLADYTEAEYNKAIGVIQANEGTTGYAAAGIFTNADMATSAAGLKAELAKTDALKAILAAIA